MADPITFRFDPDTRPGAVLTTSVLPEGVNWRVPEGWTLHNGSLSKRYVLGDPLTLTVREATPQPPRTCGLCGLAIVPPEPFLDHGEVAPPAHLDCFQTAVKVMVSRPGGPADPHPAPGDSAPVPAWRVGMTVAVDDVVTYGRQRYRALQAHTTQANQTPPSTPSLWQLVS